MGGGSGGGGNGGRSGGGGQNLETMTSSEIDAQRSKNPKSYGEYLKANPGTTYEKWTGSPEYKKAIELSQAYNKAVRRERPDIAEQEKEIRDIAAMKLPKTPSKPEKWKGQPKWA